MTISTLLSESSHKPVIVRARQLLTMNTDKEALRQPPARGDLEAIRERDRAIAGYIEDGAVVIEGQHLTYVGPWSDIAPKLRSKAVCLEVDCVTPGWIDCHTHTVFSGWRHDEFTLRNLGASYLDILEAGGGIHSSVQAVRRSRRADLTNLLVERCFHATRRGITTMEVKSGYGLATSEEVKQLRAIAEAQPEVLLDIEPTFLGAHIVPKNYRERRADYIDLLCKEMIPKVASHNLARFCDVFCDRGAFTVPEARQILEVGREHGLIPRLHADELSHAGAAELAAELGASSADHLEFVSDDAVRAMAEADVVAVLLPGVNLCLNMQEYAPARKLLEAGVEVALATDFNPGSSSTQDIGLILTMACTRYHMTPAEALVAVTRAAAKALRREDRGVLRPGTRADLTILKLDDYWQLPYAPGHNFVEGVFWNGSLVYWTSAQELGDEP